MPVPVLVNKPNFTTNLKFDKIMWESYCRIRKKQPQIDGDMIDNAIASMNYILIDYNNFLNLYSVQTEVIPIQRGLSNYQVPDFYEINDVTMASFWRQVTPNGVAATNSGGNAALAFDGLATTSCQNTSANGTITYTFFTPTATPESRIVQFVGIQTAQADGQTYNLEFFFQTDPTNPATKQVIYQTGPFTPFPNYPYYFFLNPGTRAQVWGVTEIGGATINFAEVFFSQYASSRVIKSLSRQQWMSLTDKNSTSQFAPGTNPNLPFPDTTLVDTNASGFNSAYYVDRQQNPVINFYPPPSLTYPYCVFTYRAYFQELKYLQDIINVPGSFIPALVADLTYALSLKYGEKDQITTFKQEAIQTKEIAQNQDRQKVDFEFRYDFTQFTTN